MPCKDRDAWGENQVKMETEMEVMFYKPRSTNNCQQSTRSQERPRSVSLAA